MSVFQRNLHLPFWISFTGEPFSTNCSYIVEDHFVLILKSHYYKIYCVKILKSIDIINTINISLTLLQISFQPLDKSVKVPSLFQHWCWSIGQVVPPCTLGGRVSITVMTLIAHGNRHWKMSPPYDRTPGSTLLGSSCPKYQKVSYLG